MTTYNFCFSPAIEHCLHLLYTYICRLNIKYGLGKFKLQTFAHVIFHLVEPLIITDSILKTEGVNFQELFVEHPAQ